jgi:hypothetical protein
VTSLGSEGPLVSVYVSVSVSDSPLPTTQKSGDGNGDELARCGFGSRSLRQISLYRHDPLEEGLAHSSGSLVNR